MNEQQMLEAADLYTIIASIAIGTFARFVTLKEDFRQYPSYPNGYLINIVTGFIAAALGAVAIPALMSKNFVAVTFLTLALQQFRDVRKITRESLVDLEYTEYTYRGNAYIDGISKTFEARNYITLIVSFVTSMIIQLMSISTWIDIGAGIVSGLIVLFLLKRFSKGKTIGDIADITEGKIEVKEGNLFVDGIFVSNLLGTENAEDMFQSEGLACVIHPKEQHFRINLDNFGQRQAALFEATRALGNKRYHFTRKDYEDGRVVIALVPIKRDMDALIEAVKQCPLLESAKKSHSVMSNPIEDKK